jgi:hypothetical protein
MSRTDTMKTALQTLRSPALIFFSVVVLSFTAICFAQEKTNVRTESQNPTPTPSPARAGQPRDNKKPADTTRYGYEFTQPDFTVSHIVIDHDASGRGKITFERRNEQGSIEEPVELSIGALGRVLGAWQQLNFLQSTENYQSNKQFPHLGTMRLKMEHDAQKRTAEFNWTDNPNASLLAKEYRRVADQAIFVFDVSVARETQPLNAPKLMDEAEIQLRLNGFSDPQQLVPLLQEISTDEHLPLIARNHALRLIKKIGT